MIMNEIEFIRNVFEIAFGDGAVPKHIALDEKDPNYRMPFSYDEVLDQLEMFARNSYVIEEMKSSDKEMLFAEMDMEVAEQEEPNYDPSDLD